MSQNLEDRIVQYINIKFANAAVSAEVIAERRKWKDAILRAVYAGKEQGITEEGLFDFAVETAEEEMAAPAKPDSTATGPAEKKKLFEKAQPRTSPGSASAAAPIGKKTVRLIILGIFLFLLLIYVIGSVIWDLWIPMMLVLEIPAILFYSSRLLERIAASSIKKKKNDIPFWTAAGAGLAAVLAFTVSGMSGVPEKTAYYILAGVPFVACASYLIAASVCSLKPNFAAVMFMPAATALFFCILIRGLLPFLQFVWIIVLGAAIIEVLLFFILDGGQYLRKKKK